jgi:hypothetical protein
MMMFTRKYGPWTAEEERRFLTEGQLAPATRL